MELRQLQYFLKVAQIQHVTQAAEELHIAQSAVSRQIHQLEEELGVPLFVQKGRNLQLTPAGKLFQERMETVMEELDRSVREVQEFLNPDTGEIRIGFPHSLGINLLPAIVSRFREERPGVKFRLRQGTYGSLIRDLLRRDIDLAFISPFPKDHEEVDGELLLTEELHAILPVQHPLAAKASIALAELSQDSFVMFSDAYSLRGIVLAACAEAGFTPNIEFEGEETDTIRGLVAAGLGVSLLPEMALTESLPLQPVTVKLSHPAVTRTVGIIYRTGEALPPVAAGFLAFLKRYFQDGADPEQG